MSNPFDDDFKENPFAADVAGQKREDHEIELPPDTRRGMVGHVFVLGVLMAIYGAGFIVTGLAAAAYGAFMPELLKNNPAWKNNPAFAKNPQQLPPDEMLRMMSISMIVGGILFAILGILYLIAGIQVSRFRSRILGIVALSVGLFSVVACYCIPTSLALFVYGLVVLLNDSVRLAFEYGNRGHTRAEIQQAFARLPLGQ